MKHEQIAKHGIIASIAVLITVIYNGVSIVLEDKNVGLSNVFTIATSAAFQVPIWSFVLLKRALKVDGATGSKASNQAEGDQVPSGPEGV